MRQRKASGDLFSIEKSTNFGQSEGGEVVWGKTPSGEVFRVPTTHDFLTLFHPSHPKSNLDILNLGLLALQLGIFFWLPRHTSKMFFFVYFGFWRAAYDAGLGWILTQQSKKKWIVKEVQRLGWLDENRNPIIRAWIRAQLVGKMGKDYSFDELPLEYNTWLLFRQIVDIILINDFLAYCMFSFLCFRVPEGLSTVVHVMRWISGMVLISFNLWVKVEAHNVVKVYYGWFWGDAFFQRGALVFDGVFELAPHPMYSVGYAGYYGVSLISGSYPVLFVSLAAHAAQFAFLLFFENPHIKRLYGLRTPIALRTPPFTTSSPKTESNKKSSQPHEHTKTIPVNISTTPAESDGETYTETDFYNDSETENNGALSPVRQDRKCGPSADARCNKPNKSKAVSHHDLLNKHFKSDAVLLFKLDLFRNSDFTLVLVISYSLALSFLPPLSRQSTLVLHSAHALGWCIFHCFVLGSVLRAQSKSKYLVRHFMKHYYYPPKNGSASATQEAFTNWKSTYNLSLCMTYVSFVGVVWKTYSIPSDWSVGNELLRHTMGAILVGFHIWTSIESFEVLGAFGWFFGDFFMEEFPAHLEYTGIYRYLNNPEVLGAASWFGLAMVSGSKVVVALAVIRHLSHWWFLRAVENPHMRKLYGHSLRKDAGFVKVIKSVAKRNVRLLENHAGRHGPEIKRAASEVKETFDKVYEGTAEVVEEFLAKSRPRITEVVQDTKILLQYSRQSLVIPRFANDMSSYDSAKYQISIIPVDLKGSLRFHLGQPISIKWQAPHLHSHRDWMGIYKVGVNKSSLITKTSSLGMWVPVHSEEWISNLAAFDRPLSPTNEVEKDVVVFEGDALPWSVGQYEVRYHHDAKYNVMSVDGPFEVYVQRPEALDFPSVRATLMCIVPLCLDSDPSLIPSSYQPAETETTKIDDNRDPDDFRFWTDRQAKRICVAIKHAFDVDYAPEVIVADANISALANRILLSKDFFTD